MKALITTLATLASATSAMAGALAFTPPIATTLEEPARMGGSGAWLIPLIIIAVVALAVAKKPVFIDT